MFGMEPLWRRQRQYGSKLYSAKPDVSSGVSDLRRYLPTLGRGYLEGTTGGDGEGVDVFVGSAPGVGVVAAAVTVDLARRDTEVKILADCSSVEVDTIADFLTNVLGLCVHLVRRDGR